MIAGLVVKDIFEDRTVFEKHIDRFIGGITWSPDSRSVAILTMVEKAFAMTLPPFYYYNFYLEIYDMSGRELYRDKVIGNVSGCGRIVWASHGRHE
jgi:hypothetical protein